MKNFAGLGIIKTIIENGGLTPPEKVEVLDNLREIYINLSINTGVCGFTDTGSLDTCFAWANTPQGYGYWNRIHTKMGEKIYEQS